MLRVDRLTTNFQLGRCLGIPVRVHFSWVLIVAIITWSVATGFLPSFYDGWSRLLYWGIALVATILLFGSVLIHEMSHCLVARRSGREVRGITLFLFGGISDLNEEVSSPGREFWVAIAGPVASVCLAGIALLGFVLVDVTYIRAVLGYLIIMNLVLGGFNLFPAFPMDGGRVLRAVVWKTTGSVSRADKLASRSGSLAGLALIGAGAYLLVFGSLLSGIWFLGLGWFIRSAALSFRTQSSGEMNLSQS